MKVISLTILMNLVFCACNFSGSSKGSVVRSLRQYGPFNSQQWKKDKSSRYGMSGYWKQHEKQKVGLSSEEVDNQLGPADHHETSRGYEVWMYDLMDTEYPYWKSRLKNYFKEKNLLQQSLRIYLKH
ncbi:MAG: hypothetical protein SFY67_05345 [Candidatus Melainabacteria bacterium]|nr:hypothetical protein [Candidatus Melainabacteria bacterium]